MLTGDKGKTAKMIGLQCGMFSTKISDRALENNRVTPDKSADATIQPVDDIQKVPVRDSLVLFEVDEHTNNVEGEIRKILDISRQSKLELLIDGGVFAQMLDLKAEIQAELSKALNTAAAVIIYRASPK